MKTIFPFKVIGLFVLLLASRYLAGQQLSFKRVESTANTPLSGWITGITQDQQGYLWFTSSHGLYRYDGYEVTGYFHDGSNPNSIAGGNLETVYADQQGAIWVGSQLSGLDRFDPNTGIFTHFTRQKSDSTSLSNNFVASILEDRDGVMWIGTHGGLDRLDRTSGKFTHYRHNPGDSTSLSNDQVRVLYEDHSGTLWVGTGSPFVGESPKGAGGLNRMDKRTRRFTRYMNDPTDSTTLADNRVRALFEDSHGTFWVGTFGDGLHTMDRQHETFQRYPYRPDRPSKLSRPYLQEGDPNVPFYGTLGSGVSFITEAGGDIWIGGNMGGINRYNPVTKKLTHYEPGSVEADGLIDQSFGSAFTARDGVLFLGTSTMASNLYSVSPSSIRLIHQAIPVPVTSFWEDKSGRLWLQSAEEIFVKDRTTGTLEPIGQQLRDEIGLKPHDWIHLFFSDRNGILWIGTRQGLIRYDEASHRTRRYQYDPVVASSISSDSIFAIHEDRLGNLWIGTAKGLDQMDLKQGTFTNYRHSPSDSNSLEQSRVVDVRDDRRGNLWVITRWSATSGSLNRLDRKTGKLIKHGNVNNLVAIAEDAKGLWLASRNNLYRMDAVSEEVTRFIDPQTNEGMKAIQNLLQDEQGSLWLNTLHELIQINPSRDKVRRFQLSGNNHVTGLYQGKRNFYESRQGEIFFGNRTGYYSFSLKKLPPPDKVPPQIVFHDFRLAGSKPSLINVELEETSRAASPIELNHLQDAFSIGFAGIHFGQPELNEHLFQLEGYDQSWRQSNSERTAYYYNVPPGRYNFRVKAANGDGIWAERAVTIVIYPPWWRTWWAYSFYGISFCALLIAFIRYRISLEREKQRIERRDWESQQLKTLDEMKTRFFSNITHEFRTPLSLILPATEQLIKEFPGSHDQRRLLVIKRQAGQLLHLINQLLDLSKLESGSMLATKQRGDIAMFTSQVVNSFRPAAEEKGIALELVNSVDAGSWYFDADKWEKIVNNLISNALKFTQTGGRVKVTFQLADPGNASRPSIILSVEDGGQGIPTDKLSHIFDRFYQVDNSTTRQFEGSGIGLSLVKEMVELLNGRVDVESRLGMGTTFTVNLPVEKASDTVESVAPSFVAQETHPSNSALSRIEFNGDKINDESLPLVLIVEDHSDLREFIAESLCRSYRVLTAASGQEGITLTREHVPDVVISDVMMPGMDGFELTDLIKKDPNTNHIAVVLLTAKAAQESKLAGLGVGADDYLTKPFHFDELALRIHNIIDRQRKLHHRYQQQLKLDTAPLVETVQDKFWQSLCEAVEARLDDPTFDVDALASSVNTSRRTLYRKLATLTGLTPIEVIRDYRLKRARQFLSQGLSVSETAYRVGFESPSYFGKCFKEVYQTTPSEYVQERMAQSQQ